MLTLKAIEQSLVLAYTPRVRYHVKIDNALSADTLDTHCFKHGLHYKDLGHYHIPVNGNFNWTFRTYLFGLVYYECTLTWPNHGFISFTAFIDNADFVDNYCGGRHCFWKAVDDGIYLYNIKKKIYVFRGSWVKP